MNTKYYAYENEETNVVVYVSKLDSVVAKGLTRLPELDYEECD